MNRTLLLYWLVNLITTGLWKQFLVEVILNIIVVPPGLDKTITMLQVGNLVVTPLDTIVCVISVSRLYTIYPRLLLTHYIDDYSPINDRTIRVW